MSGVAEDLDGGFREIVEKEGARALTLGECFGHFPTKPLCIRIQQGQPGTYLC